MIQACLYLLAGMYVPQLSSFASGSDLIALAIVSGFVAAFLNAWHGPSWFFAGFGMFAYSAAGILDDRLDQKFVGDSILTTVRIADFPQWRGPTLSLTAVPQEDARLPRRLRVTWFEPQVVPAFGEVWQIELRLRRPRGNLNPGIFDYEAWLFRSRTGATGYVVDSFRNRRLEAGNLGAIDTYRRHFVTRVSRLLPDPDSAAVLAAISVGARHNISRAQWERYARTGTSHLMAISGLHIGLAAAGAYLLVRLLVGIRSHRVGGHVVASVVAFVAAGVYGLVSGLALPAQRATIMLGLVSLAIARRREVRPYRVLAAAGLLLAMLGPIETMAPGFKLSFAAVLLLVWLGQQRRRRQPARAAGRWRGRARQLLALQLALLFVLLPLTTTIFNRAAIMAPVVNFIAVPLFSLVTVPFMLAGMVFDGPARLIGDHCLQLAAASIQAVEAIVAIAAELPGADATTAQLQGMAYLLLLLPPLWVIVPSGWPGRGLAGLGVVAILLYQPPRVPYGCFDVTVLDVGQGLAVVIRTRNRAVLYDTGPAFRSGSSMAETVVLPYLAARGISHLDALVVSHSDIDHAGGVRALLAAIDVDRVISGEILQGLDRPAEPCRAGGGWRADGVLFRFLHPPREPPFEGNNASCVLEIGAGSDNFLISGDIEEPAEDWLLRTGLLGKVKAAVVPHHGSVTSSSPDFIGALASDLGIVSAGHGNRWGLPRQEIVTRWRLAGATVISTAEAGAIRARLCPGTGLESLLRFRDEHRRIWRE